MNRDIEGLRNHLFAQLERIGDEDLSGKDLDQEIRRGKALSEIAGTIISTAKVEVEYTVATGRSMNTKFLPQDTTKQLGNDK